MKEYAFNERLMILETKYTGILDLEVIISHYERITTDDSLPRILSVLIDVREAEFKVNLDKMDLTSQAVKNALLKYKYIKEAIMVNNPASTAVALFFEKINPASNSYVFRVFSTESAARKWL